MMRFTKLKCEEVCQLYMQSWSGLFGLFRGLSAHSTERWRLPTRSANLVAERRPVFGRASIDVASKFRRRHRAVSQ